MKNNEIGFKIKANFIGDFKLGDNINYNLLTLKYLYKCEPHIDNFTLLNKPIIITIMSIIEAVLHDLFGRISFHTCEGISNMTTDILDTIRSKKIDKLQKYIDHAKKHNFFDSVNLKFYNHLNDLTRIRNRVHIQNDKKHKPYNEVAVFSDDNKYIAECALEVVMKTMESKYPRPANLHNFVSGFFIPWPERYQI